MPRAEELLRDSWEAQHLRLVSFPAEPQFTTEQNWWFELTGTEREGRSDKRHSRQEEGPFEGTTLTLAIDPNQLRWTASPQVDQDDRPPSIGPFESRKLWFQELMHRWLATSPPLTRLAFSGTLLRSVSDRAAGLEIMERYVRLPEVPSEATDLLFRINLPTDFTLGDKPIKINRLTTWSVATFACFRAQVGASIHPSATQIGEFHAFTLAFDVNTALEVDCSSFTNDELKSVFEQLIAESEQIAEQGFK